MKAIRIHAYGGPEALVVENAPDPEVGPGQVLVEVEAVTINHIDVKMASGEMKGSAPLDFPWTPGVDFAGRVDFTGAGVEQWSKGDQVYGKIQAGSYARYIAVAECDLARMPAGLSFTEAASVPHVGLTAWEAVFEHGRIEPGQKVLIHGASGAVGQFALQFAKLAGAFVWAVDSPRNIDYLTSLGADVAIDHTSADLASIVDGADMVLDLVGGDTAFRSFPLMGKGGTLVSTVATPDKTEAEKYGVNAIYMGVHPDFSDLSEITDLIEEGSVKPDVALAMPVEQVREAWEIFTKKKDPERRFDHGKIALVFS